MAEKNRGFDVLGRPYEAGKDYVSSLVQVFNDINTLPPEDHPGVANVAGKFLLKRTGDRLMAEYHLMDINLDDNARCESLVRDCNRAIGDMCKELKRQFRKRTKVSLNLKEDRESGGWHREKVSLNGRWYLRTWRVYDVTPEADQSDED